MIGRLSLLTLLLICWGKPAAGQINFEDGFENGNFSEAPEWTGSGQRFTVDTFAFGHLLRLDSQDTEPAWLSTPSTAINGQWEFYMEMDGFAPSGSNRADIFLMSDRADLWGDVNGYAVRMGETGDDFFKIVRYDGGSEAAVVLEDTLAVGSSGGGYVVRVTRSAAGEWTIATAEGYLEEPVSAGITATDAVHTAATHFGIRVRYTSTRSDRFLFDFKIDRPPFRVSGFSAGPRHLELSFNGEIDPASVDAGDLTIIPDPGLTPLLSFPAADLLLMEFPDSLDSGDYLLDPGEILDVNGQALEIDSPLPFTVFGSPRPGDLQINEFAWDPPEGAPEYVELANRSGQIFNLSGWQVGDDSRLAPVSIDTLRIDPDGLLVFTSDTVMLKNIWPGSGPAYRLSGFPFLNNTGDAVRLVSPDGETIDSLRYEPSWGGMDGVLERLSAVLPATMPENWAKAPGQPPGSPGLPNGALPDEVPPRLEEVRLVSRDRIRLLFSERLSGPDITDPSRYRITPQRDIRLIAAQHDRVDLYLDTPLQSGTTYVVEARGLADLFGNRMVRETRTVRFLEFDRAEQQDIVINEILFLEGDDTPEFLELYNVSEKNIDLSGWTVSDATGSAALPSGTVMEAETFLVLSPEGAFPSAGPRVHLVDMPVWNNETDRVVLKNRTGEVIDSLQYERKWAEVGPGISLERIDPERVSVDPSNWGAGGEITPGTVNSIYHPDRTAPQVLFARIRSLQIVELEMDEFVTLTPEVIFHAGGRPLDVELFDASAANRVLLRSSISLGHSADGHPPRIRIRNLSDPKGNTAGEQLIPLVFPPDKGDLTINEILFAPIRRADDHLPDQSEYVELVNRRSRAISLEGIYLHDAPDEDGQIRRLHPVSGRQRWIPAGGFALLHADTAGAFRESDTYRYFEPDTSRPRSILRFDRTTLGLSSDADAVYLADSSGTVIDSVHYRGDWHNPHLPDPRGIALERIDPDGPGMSPLNWSSSTAAAGGTPLADNSILRIAQEAPLKQGITLSPNPFSPDSDGYEDHLAITWRLDGPDYLLRVRIHDRYGRRVRSLADGIPGGPEGVLLWDGLRDDRRRNRIGIYIVLFEAYNPATGAKRTWKKTAVLARRLR